MVLMSICICWDIWLINVIIKCLWCLFFCLYYDLVKDVIDIMKLRIFCFLINVCFVLVSD